MSGNLKELKIRIGGVKKTKQITSAMKLVAGAKLARATARASAAQPYQVKLAETLSRVASRAGDEVSHPLLEQRESIKKVMLVIITSDRGLCGPFNNGLMRKAVDWIETQQANGVHVDIVIFGRKAEAFLRSRDIDIVDSHLDYMRTPPMDNVRTLSDSALTAFDSGDVDQVVLASNKFVNTLVQEPTFNQVVPISVPKTDDGEDSADGNLHDYLYEPTPAVLMGKLLPLYLRTQLLQAFLETEAGFYAAQMTAMDSATKNASELIDDLTLVYNRARQAAITTEITEIVSGAEAL